ncbi:J domain-containing protein [Anaerovorax odorimutans]|uniref:J domain-containing protein n=1 Tax=Anaerovorax odorimutans TaxID=109327 RepID=UPI0003FD2B73|nr:J domain-containing protein [Anaerovorax odorimutans]
MQNPYEILGVKEGASKEEIKAAYREQVKKYHPDKFQDNPLYELAEEKLQEINEAYDYLMKNNGSGGSSYSTSSNQTGMNPQFMEIRKNIDRGNLPLAESMLNKMRDKNAEWFFLNGMISLKKGWYDNALSNVQTAISMDPSNMEYKNAMNSIMGAAGGYRTTAYGRGYNGAGSDPFCQALQCYCCADLCCDCI